MTDSSPLLKLENVSREFPSAEGDQPLRVLRGLSLEVARGESVAVVGPSGCGKSTLLNLIGSLDQPTGGHSPLTATNLAVWTTPSLPPCAIARWVSSFKAIISCRSAP